MQPAVHACAPRSSSSARAMNSSAMR
jgi:hypothetical protein